MPRHPRPSLVRIGARPNLRTFSSESTGPKGSASVSLSSRTPVCTTIAPPFVDVPMLALLSQISIVASGCTKNPSELRGQQNGPKCAGLLHKRCKVFRYVVRGVEKAGGIIGGRDSPSASGAPENCRIRLTFSLLTVLSITVADFPRGPAAEDLDGPLELLGGDLASGEALPEDLLRRVPGRLQSLVPADLGKDAHHQPRYDGHEPAQKQNE